MQQTYARTQPKVWPGTTLKSTRKLVRKKLGLASGTDLTLVHLREGARVDLEDGTWSDSVFDI